MQARSKNCEKRLLASSYLSARMEQLITTGRIYMKFDIWVFFEKLSTTFEFNYIGQERRALYMRQADIHFWSYVAHFFLEWKMFQTKVVEKIKTRVLC